MDEPSPHRGMVLRATGGAARTPRGGMLTARLLARIREQLEEARTWCGEARQPLLGTLLRQAEEYAGHGLAALENFHRHYLEARLRAWREERDAEGQPGENPNDTTDKTDTTSR